MTCIVWICLQTCFAGALPTLYPAHTHSHCRALPLQVERKWAIHNFMGIVEAADAVIFSRGNLGLDFDPGALCCAALYCPTLSELDFFHTMRFCR